MLNAEGIKRDIVVIGASAGGVEALMQLFRQLPANLPASIAVVIHRSPVQRSNLTKVLGGHAALPVAEPAYGELFQKGRIYLAPADHHLTLNHRHLHVTRGPKEHMTRPAVDPLFRSAAASYGSRTVGIVLTGGGDDGVSGLIAIKQANGLALVQDPSDAKISAMPSNAVRFDHVDRVLPLERIPAVLTALVQGEMVK
jgi:two-component system chemotaxis response regulator CheB